MYLKHFHAFNHAFCIHWCAQCALTNIRMRFIPICVCVWEIFVVAVVGKVEETAQISKSAVGSSVDSFNFLIVNMYMHIKHYILHGHLLFRVRE